MPLYEFECTECGVVYEALLKYDEVPDTCPECGSTAPQKKKLTCTRPYFPGTPYGPPSKNSKKIESEADLAPYTRKLRGR